jgi:branched-subunit amino acid aminotransferase/4-amino-4-deoxychorismate lyase
MPRAPASLPLFVVTESGARRVRVRAGSPDAAQRDVHAALVGPGPAVYTGLRSLGARGMLALDAHLDRLADSCVRVGLPPPPRTHLRAALRQAVPTDDDVGCMVRVEVRATPPPLVDTDATVLIGLWPARPVDPGRQAAGVSVVTAPGARRQAPKAKGSAWIVRRAAWVRDPDAAEHLLLDDTGALLEGFTSNLLLVAGGDVYAPTEGVLPGITLGRVLGLCDTLGVPVRTRPWPGPPTGIEELAILSSGRGIWPVTRLDGARVGGGRAGPIIRRLLAAWDAALPGWLQHP